MLGSTWLFPYLPPVELDAGRFEAIVGVIMDKFHVDSRIPHHLLMQPASQKMGKPQPPIPMLPLGQQQPTGHGCEHITAS